VLSVRARARACVRGSPFSHAAEISRRNKRNNYLAQNFASFARGAGRGGGKAILLLTGG